MVKSCLASNVRPYTAAAEHSRLCGPTDCVGHAGTLRRLKIERLPPTPGRQARAVEARSKTTAQR
jgi:hypothetical protein